MGRGVYGASLFIEMPMWEMRGFGGGAMGSQGRRAPEMGWKGIGTTSMVAIAEKCYWQWDMGPDEENEMIKSWFTWTLLTPHSIYLKIPGSTGAMCLIEWEETSQAVKKGLLKIVFYLKWKALGFTVLPNNRDSKKKENTSPGAWELR